METETVEIEKERRTALAYLRNEKTAESNDQAIDSAAQSDG